MTNQSFRDALMQGRFNPPEPPAPPPIRRIGEPRQPLTLCFRSLVIGVFLGAGLNILAILAGLYWA